MKPRAPKAVGCGRLGDPRPSADDSNTLRPHFSLEHLESGFDVNCCSREHQAEFAKALADWSRLTWSQIISSNRRGLGAEKISTLNKPYPTCVPADKRDKIISFRFGHLARFIGYRDQRVFYIVWIDPNGELYSHGS